MREEKGYKTQKEQIEECNRKVAHMLWIIFLSMITATITVLLIIR